MKNIFSKLIPQTTMSKIPDEIIYYHILTQLPVKSVLRFKSVCKNWYNLINSSTFIHIHHKYNSTDIFVVRFGFTNTTSAKVCFYTHLDAPHYVRGTDVMIGTFNLDSRVSIVGSCNGFICLETGISGLALCNPITREFRDLIDPPNRDNFPLYVNNYGFGYDSVGSDYKIVNILMPYNFDFVPQQNLVQVFSISTNSWEEVKYFPSCARVRGHGVALNNTLHWLCLSTNHEGDGYIILTFDLHTHEFGLMSYPDVFKKDSKNVFDLVVSSGRLYSVAYRTISNYSIWLMEEYGIVESWTKLYENMGKEVFPKKIELLSYHFRRGSGEVLLANRDNGVTSELVWFNLEDKSIRIVDVPEKRKYIGKEWVCIGSLAPIPNNNDSR